MTSGYLIRQAQIATMVPGGPAYGLVRDGALAVRDGRIAWIGADTDIPVQFAGLPVEDAKGALLTPGLIDCHTHIVFGGDRAREFAMRLEGASYQQIAAAGGGIVSTVRATRALDVDGLVAAALPRVDALLAEGVTALEVKSGYGLSIEAELRMLRAARRLAEVRPVTIRTSWLAAHALPADYAGRPDAYIDEICIAGLDAAHHEGLIDAVDGFCESIAFDTVQMARLFDRAKALGIPVKLHAEQLSDMGGAKLAASYGALSADHLEYIDPAGVAAMAAAGSVAVILPGAFYALRETKLPPIAEFRAAGVPMALSTDCNPGTSPMTSLLLAMNMGCTLFRLTAEEALAGTTRNAARALGLSAEAGTLEPGKRADLALWSVSDPAELSYRIGFNPLLKRFFGGSA